MRNNALQYTIPPTKIKQIGRGQTHWGGATPSSDSTFLAAFSHSTGPHNFNTLTLCSRLCKKRQIILIDQII